MGAKIGYRQLLDNNSLKIDIFAFVNIRYTEMRLTLQQIEKISKALGDSNRLKILHYISGKGGCGECSALQNIIGLAQPSVSHHVKILMESGLISAEKDGRNYNYTLNTGVLNEYTDSLRQLA
jgi:ArsR family transcriptional regulator